MEIKDIIKERRKQLGYTLSDVAKKVGVNPSTVSRWEHGEIDNMKRDKIHELAKALELHPDVIMGWESPSDPPAKNLILPNAKTVPILGRISCGNGNFLNDDSEGTFTLDYSIKADYCLIASGDSMIDAGIENGDKVFLSQNYEFTDGKVYGVVLKGEDIAVLKMVNKIDDKFLLQSCNSSGQYKPIIVDQSEICIVGECIGIYKSL